MMSRAARGQSRPPRHPLYPGLVTLMTFEGIFVSLMTLSRHRESRLRRDRVLEPPLHHLSPINASLRVIVDRL